MTPADRALWAHLRAVVADGNGLTDAEAHALLDFAERSEAPTAHVSDADTKAIEALREAEAARVLAEATTAVEDWDDSGWSAACRTGVPALFRERDEASHPCAEATALRAMLDRIAETVSAYFDPACEECIADGVESMVDALETERDEARVDLAKTDAIRQIIGGQRDDLAAEVARLHPVVEAASERMHLCPYYDRQAQERGFICRECPAECPTICAAVRDMESKPMSDTTKPLDMDGIKARYEKYCLIENPGKYVLEDCASDLHDLIREVERLRERLRLAEACADLLRKHVASDDCAYDNAPDAPVCDDPCRRCAGVSALSALDREGRGVKPCGCDDAPANFCRQCVQTMSELREPCSCHTKAGR